MGLQPPPNPGLCPARGPGPRRGAGAAARPQTLDGTRTPWHGGLPSGGGGCRRKARGGGVCGGERIYRPPPRPFPGRARGPGDAAPWGPWPVGSERGGADSGGAAPGGGGGGGSAGSGPAAGRLRALRGRRSAPPKRCQRLRGRALRRGPPPGKQQATAAFPPTPVPLALGGGRGGAMGELRPSIVPPRTPGVPPLSTVPGQRSRPWAPGSPAGWAPLRGAPVPTARELGGNYNTSFIKGLLSRLTSPQIK